MKIAVGVLTHNATSNMRSDLVERTLDSIAVAFKGHTVIPMDNGSTDGSEQIAIINDGVVYRSDDGDHSPGRGNKVLGRLLLDADIAVMSDDDMIWKPEAADTLIKFWSAKPPVTILGGYLEPDWHWNKPIRTIESGGVRALVRESAPTCAWTFLTKNWSSIEPLMPDGFGHDFKTCVALRERGHIIAQIDLADHVGWGRSTYGNNADTFAKPLDRVKWGL